jgi:hypothetical protein
MKRILLTPVFLLLTYAGFSQQNMITISGGYVFGKLNGGELVTSDPDVKGSGWRVNGLYEFNPAEGKVAYGFSMGYISVSANDDSGLDTVEYKVSTIPIYFAPKYIFGNETIKGFIKGALGVQSARIERTGVAGSLEASDFGFYGGVSAGLMVFVHEKIFLNAEYEFAYMSNSYYTDGLLNSVMLGIGIKF